MSVGFSAWTSDASGPYGEADVDWIRIGPKSDVFFDGFTGTSLSSGWSVENRGGSYSLNNSILTLSSNNPSVTVYRDFVPQADNFTVSARVRSRDLAAFALRIQARAQPKIDPRALMD